MGMGQDGASYMGCNIQIYIYICIYSYNIYIYIYLYIVIYIYIYLYIVIYICGYRWMYMDVFVVYGHPECHRGNFNSQQKWVN